MRSSVFQAIVGACLASCLFCCGSAASAPVEEIPPADRENISDYTVPAAEAPPSGQLPRNVVPTHYRLSLEISPREETFRGRVEIAVSLSEQTRSIWLHGRGLRVLHAEVVADSGGAPIPARYREIRSAPEDSASRSGLGIANLELASLAPAGSATIRISFDGRLGQGLSGLYHVRSAEHDFAFTQFEAIAAREAFPCFDEPAFKTPFDVELIVPSEDVAVANTLPTSEAIEGAKKRVRFATTEKLPTYLLAWAVGPLDVVEAAPLPASAVRPRELPFRLIAERGRAEDLEFARTQTPKIVEALETYFGMEYPYDKLDVIAVPDFAFSGMENAGAITFRDSVLLLKSGQASVEQRIKLLSVMTHELGHQWFGNLVTMPWWNDIWLNEAFATWIAAKVMTQLFPQYESDLEQLEETHWAMGVDSVPSARRIRQPIESSHDIETAFDSITYEKGAAVLSMFEAYLGEEAFQEGIRAYLREHAFGTATADDVVAAFSREVGRDVGPAFRSFLDQPGVPTLSAELRCEMGSPPRLHVTQTRYFALGVSESSDATRWLLPVCVRYPSRERVREFCTLMEDSEADIPLDGQRCPAWVMPNANASGYYRYSLSQEMWGALMTAGWSKLSHAEQLSLADNLLAGAKAGDVPFEVVARHFARFAGGRDSRLLAKTFDFFSEAKDRWVTQEHQARVEEYLQRSYRDALASVGFVARAGETELTTAHRERLLAFLALTARDPSVRARLAAWGRDYVGDLGDTRLHEDAVSPGLRRASLIVFAQEADETAFNALVSHFQASHDGGIRRALLTAIGAVEDPQLAVFARTLTLNENLRVNERRVILHMQMENRRSREAAWAWMKAQLSEVLAAFSEAGAELPYMTTSFCDASRIDEIRTTFTPVLHQVGGARNLEAAIEELEQCAAISEHHAAAAVRFFGSRSGRSVPALNATNASAAQ